MTPPGSADEGAGRDPIDEEALADLIHRYQARLLARIRLMMGPAARQCLESGDVLHDVFMEAMRELREGDLKDEAVFLRWLTAVARHHIIDAVRAGERSFESLTSDVIEKGDSSVPAKLTVEERKQRMIEAIERLEADRRRVIELRSLENLPWQRVAAELGRSEEAARKLYHRAMLELGQILGKPPPGM